jgi:hypothetical protein
MQTGRWKQGDVNGSILKLSVTNTPNIKPLNLSYRTAAYNNATDISVIN